MSLPRPHGQHYLLENGIGDRADLKTVRSTIDELVWERSTLEFLEGCPSDDLLAILLSPLRRVKVRSALSLIGRLSESSQNLQIIGVTNVASSQAIIAIPLPMER